MKTKKAETAALAAKAGETEERGPLIDIEEAIALLKTSRPSFYRWLRSGKLKGMKVGRQWRFYKKDIESFLKGEAPRIELAADISPLLDALEKALKEAGAKDIAPAAGDPAIAVVARTIRLAWLSRASDIHLTSHIPEGQSTPVGFLRVRVDGALRVVAKFDARLVPALIERWKIMANCDVHERQKPQDGRIIVSASELSAGAGDKTLDLRVCFLPAAIGETLTVRLLSREQVQLHLDRLSFSPHDLARIRRALELPWGTIICTGPTGCGKTTVLYSCLQELSRPEVKILTVEDPVEYMLPWATQVQIRPQLGLGFPAFLRSTLRSDPDVIMIGEIRDLETLAVATQAALTGHLVLSTLHTEDAASALVRMRDMGMDPDRRGPAAARRVPVHGLPQGLHPERRRTEADGRSGPPGRHRDRRPAPAVQGAAGMRKVQYDRLPRADGDGGNASDFPGDRQGAEERRSIRGTETHRRAAGHDHDGGRRGTPRGRGPDDPARDHGVRRVDVRKRKALTRSPLLSRRSSRPARGRAR